MKKENENKTEELKKELEEELKEETSEKTPEELKEEEEERKEREEFEKDIEAMLEEQMAIKKGQKKKKKIFIGAIASVVAVVAIGVGTLAYQISQDKIAKGISIAGEYVGDMTETEALKKLEDNKFDNVILRFGEDKFILPNNSIDLKLDKKAAVKRAYKENRTNNIVSNLVRTLESDFGKKSNIGMDLHCDWAKVRDCLEGIKERVDSPVENATMNYEDEKAVLVPDKPGRSLDIDKTIKDLKENLKNNKFETKLMVNLEKAKFTTENLKGIDTLLGGYSTTFGGMPGRDYNIAKAANDSGNMLLQPGEEFSFNGILGEKTRANGYKSAPVISDGKLILGVGGGVCQTSSTIFNAALLSGMDITARRCHTIPSGYVSLGRDATIVDGKNGQDLKFKNPFKHPVFIKNYAKDGKVVSQIYGFKEDFKHIDIYTQTLGSFGGGSKTVTDPSLAPGKKVVERYARAGYNVATYRIYKDDNGKVIKSERVANSRYPAQTGVVRVGPAAASKPVAKPAQKPQQMAGAQSNQ